MKKPRTKRPPVGGGMVFKEAVSVQNGSIIGSQQNYNYNFYNNEPDAGKPRKDIPRLLTYRMNRSDQEKRFREIYGLYKPEAPLPIVTVIHGNEDQALDMFLERLRVDFIPKKLVRTGRNRPLPEHVPIHDLAVNQSLAEFQDRLREHLAIKLVSEKGNASIEKIQQRLARSNCPTVIEILLSEEFLLSHKTNVLEAILDFWNGWPDLSAGQALFVFIYFAYAQRPESSLQKRFRLLLGMDAKSQIRSQLMQFPFQNYAKTISAVLPELANVPRFETEVWAREEGQLYHKDQDIEDLLSHIRTIYQDEQPKPMYLVAKALRTVLENE